MTDTTDLKLRWHEANGVVDQLEEERHKLLAPTDSQYHMALDALKTLDDQCDALGAIRCVSCAGPIFEEDPYFGIDDIFCLACAPTYQALLDEPELFLTADGEPATVEQCRMWFDEHIAAGGVPTDTMAMSRISGEKQPVAHETTVH